MTEPLSASCAARRRHARRRGSARAAKRTPAAGRSRGRRRTPRRMSCISRADMSGTSGRRTGSGGDSSYFTQAIDEGSAVRAGLYGPGRLLQPAGHLGRAAAARGDAAGEGCGAEGDRHRRNARRGAHLARFRALGLRLGLGCGGGRIPASARARPGLRDGARLVRLLPGVAGRFDEAIASIKRAQEIEPVSLSIGTDVGEIHYWARTPRRWRSAELEAVLQVEPDFAMARNILGLTYLAMGRRTGGGGTARGRQPAGGGPRMLSTLAYAYGAAGFARRADDAIEALHAAAERALHFAVCPCLAHLGAGETDEALESSRAGVCRTVRFDGDSARVSAARPAARRRRFRALIDRVGIPARLP